ncbi:MAG TPA: hypothetical protein VII45_12680 [Solirubrobacterales bacterium]
MPETAIEKNGDAMSGKNDVRLCPDTINSDNKILAKTKAGNMQGAP